MKNVRRGGKIWRVDFTEFHEKVRNSREIHFFHENGRKSVEFRENPLFRAAETQESAESTKQYEFPLGIGWIATQNHVFTGIHFLRGEYISAESGFPREKWISGENVILGGNTTNSEWEFILFRGFCGFRCFRDAKE